MNEGLAIIRKRYQLTIPYPLREMINWLRPQKAVKINLVDKEKLLIEPYRETAINWEGIWKALNKIKKWSGKTSLAKFVINDRESH